MNNRIIIENRSRMPDSEAVLRVSSVIGKGRISGEEGRKQYCYATTMQCSTGFCAVYALLNKNSDRFIVEDQQ